MMLTTYNFSFDEGGGYMMQDNQYGETNEGGGDGGDKPSHIFIHSYILSYIYLVYSSRVHLLAHLSLLLAYPPNTSSHSSL